MRKLLWISIALSFTLFSLILLFSVFAIPSASARSLGLSLNSGIESRSPKASLTLNVNYNHNWVEGSTSPGATVWLTVTDGSDVVKNSAVVLADPSGSFFVACQDWFDGSCPQIEPGDLVDATVPGATATVGPLGTIMAELDEVRDLVTGTIQVPGLSGPLDVRCEVWIENGPGGILAKAEADGGSFTCDFGADGWDLEAGQEVALTYFEPDGDGVINLFGFPWMRVQYGPGDWVGGNYEAGHTIWLTVTDDGGLEKATATVSTVVGEGWGGDGFEVEWDEWDGEAPDILPGDTVHFRADDGYTHTVNVGTVAGILDVAADRITGTIQAPAFTEAVPVECHPWGAPYPVDGRNSTAMPDGSTIYTCDWSGEWDIRPGQAVAVMYLEPDQDRVINTFEESAPYLALHKEAQGTPGEGGNLRFQLNAANEGQANAEGVVISDTLLGMSYLADTSSYPVHVSAIQGGETITWDVGTLPAGQNLTFDVYVQINVPATSNIANTALITTSTPYNQSGPEEWEHTWQGQVATSDVDASLDKWAWTGEPAPDTDFIFAINPCNQGSTSSSRVTITDTLHPSMTVQSWWSDTPGWVKTSNTPRELVLTHPTLANFECAEVNLLVHLDADAWQGMTISNTAVISTVDDGGPGNDEAAWWGQVGEPYTNLWIAKGWGNGQLLPGGYLVYHIGYGNDGTLPVTETFRVTDTLPISTTFVGAWRDSQEGPETFTPTLVTGEKVVWEIEGIGNGYNGQFNVQLEVDAEATPGLPLVNTVELQRLPAERRYEDNEASWSETVYPSGPNLRVQKEHHWNGDGQFHYEIAVGNVGDETIYQVSVTDTYPMLTAASGWPGWDYWGAITVTDSAPTNQWLFELEALAAGEQARLWFDVDLDPAIVGEPLNWFTNTVEIMIPDGDVNPADNGYTDVAFSGGEIRWIDVGVYDGHIWGSAPQGPVTVTTAYGEANLPAEFDWYAQSDFLPGDVVTITAGAGRHPVVIAIPDPFSATADGETDMVWGQVDHLDHEWINVDIHNHATQQVQTDGEGRYLAVFDDFPRGSYGEVRYQTQIDYADVTFHRYFRSRDLLLRVYYDSDYIEGDFPAGHTLFITVTDSGGTKKGMATVESVPGGGWGGDGFQVMEEQWQLEQPDIIPGDWVYVRADNGKRADAHVGQIGGSVDVDADQITGAITDTWIVPPELLDVDCHPWSAPPSAPNPTNKHSSASSDGSVPYRCAWDPVAEWDVVPGQEIMVQYFEPDGDSVLRGFREPAPYLRLQKHLEGWPAEGGNVRFTVQYWNDGLADAANVVLTDTLYGFRYLYDTSSVAVMTQTVPGGEQMVLELGTVPAGSYGRIEVFAEVLSPAGWPVSNTAVIRTDSPYDQGEPWEKEALWEGDVRANDTHLSVGKHAWTNDPAPGTTVVYQVDVCNNGTTDSSYLYLTDTLSLQQTLVGWAASEAGWIELPGGGRQGVFVTPALSAGHCSTLLLRGNLKDTVEVGTIVSNSVVITAANDLGGDDNQAFWEATVTAPYTNLQAEKWWDSGVLVPGGKVSYWLRVANTGNRPVEQAIRLTETLPISTSFGAAWQNDEWGNRHPVAPLLTGDGQVVWEIAGLPNGYAHEFLVELRTDDNALPGTVLTNVLTVGTAGVEATYDDNVAVVVEEVYPAGLNLRVDKQGWWHDWGENTRGAGYQVRLENVGDIPLYGPTITDTYPAGMVLDGDPGVEYWREWSWGHDAGNNLLTVTLELLNPGESAWFWYNTIVPGSGALPPGLAFTNTVQVTTLPGDTNPADNVDSVVLTTGPDLFVEKTLVAGENRPGEILTFSLRFGNDRPGHKWWWNMEGMARLTDTLPAGMRFITATQRYCEGTEWCAAPPASDDGTQLIWDLWPLATGETNEIYLTVRMTDAITSSLFLTNRVEIASSEPVSDAEVLYANNRDELPLIVYYPPQFDLLSIQNGSDLFLSWLADPAYVSYQVWRTEVPYFLPQESQAKLIVSGTQTETVDPGTTGDGLNSYYLLVGVDAEGTRHWDARVGAFEFHLWPGD